jgi:hypothetical protein
MGDTGRSQDAEGMTGGKSGSDANVRALPAADQHQLPEDQRAETGDDPSPFHSQHASMHQQSSQLSTLSEATPYLTQPQHGQPYPFNMGGMAAALPDYGQSLPQGYSRQPAPRPMAGASNPAIVYQMQPNFQYPPQGAPYPPPAPTYGTYGQPPYPQQYSQSPGGSPQTAYGPPYPQGQSRPTTITPSQYTQGPVQYYYYDAYAHQTGSPTSYSPQGGQYPGGARGSSSSIVSGQIADPKGRRLSGGYASHYHPTPPSGDDSRKFSANLLQSDNLTWLQIARRVPESAISAIPRGPPRKPKQSGHALWVGNLPPGASILALKDHFSRDAKREIESLFLISKSNCAFVNYRTEEACERAVARFHDSRFQGVRLVCRLRKTSTAAPGAPSGPSSITEEKTTQASSMKASHVEEGSEEEDDDEAAPDSASEHADSSIKSSERYFIVKSLTLQDLEQSVRNGIWATQSHNEDALNKAYSVSFPSKVLPVLANP